MPFFETAIAAGVVAAVIIAVGAWFRFYRTPWRHRRRNLKIVESLDKIRLAADEKRLRGHDAPNRDVSGEFVKLAILFEDCPAAHTQDLRDMEDRWQQINLQFKEYGAQSVASTLQSSILSTRTMRLANEIGELAKHIEKKLKESS